MYVGDSGFGDRRVVERVGGGIDRERGKIVRGKPGNAQTLLGNQ